MEELYISLNDLEGWNTIDDRKYIESWNHKDVWNYFEGWNYIEDC